MPVAVPDAAVDHVPGVLGVAEQGVDALGGPSAPGGGGVGVEPGGDGGHAQLADCAPGEDLGDDVGAGRVEGDVIREGFDVCIGLAEAASQLTWDESEVVPGLLQAEAYARTLIKVDNPGVGPGGDQPRR